jgi:hypothetical protein
VAGVCGVAGDAVAVEKINRGAATMDDLEHMERKLSLSVAPELPFNERLERIRTALVSVMDLDDSVSAMKLQRYSRINMISFIRMVVENDNRKRALAARERMQ